MSFVLLGTLAINCGGALLAAPFLYNAYGQNLYINEFNWWFRLFTFILIFGCNGTGLYGILKFKTKVCKITSYLSVSVWFFVLVMMLLGSRNASIVAMRNSMGTAALESKSLSCAVRTRQSEANQTSWSGICYILGICLLLNFQAAAAFFMQTLVIIPVDLEALEDSSAAIHPTDVSETNLGSFKQADLKISRLDAPSPNKDTDLSSATLFSPSAKQAPIKPQVLKPAKPEVQPEDNRPTFGRPVPINSLTVKKFHPTRKREGGL